MFEIERKFLVKNNGYKKYANGILYMQGYLNNDPERTVRVRIADGKGYLTIKGKSKDFLRQQFEYEIPERDATEMLEYLCIRPVIKKLRYRVPYKGFVWEIDEFLEENEGLVLAEIELEHEKQFFEIPDFIGAEVTGDIRYYNSYLVQHPFKNW